MLAIFLYILASFSSIAASDPSSEIPTNATGRREPTVCKIGTYCRFTDPLFTCDFQHALRIAEQGGLTGQKLGNDFVHEGSCEIVAAPKILATEASPSTDVIYLTDQGAHVGYTPVGVFATGSASPQPTAAPVNQQPVCQGKGYCAVTSSVWGCPDEKGLSLADSAKPTAKCIQVPEGSVGKLWSDDAKGGTTTALQFGGYNEPTHPYQLYFSRSSLKPLVILPRTTNSYRGWCRSGEWCVTVAPAVLCKDEASLERVLAAPSGDSRRSAITAERECRTLLRGDVLKPLYEGDPSKQPLEVEHPVHGKGFSTRGPFKTVSDGVPIRMTARIGDIVINHNRAPPDRAIMLEGQGTLKAAGVFRTTERDMAEDCKREPGEDSDGYNACLKEASTTQIQSVTAKASCTNLNLEIFNQVYHLKSMPADAQEKDLHLSADQLNDLWEVAPGEYLDGTTVSNEIVINSAFDALCPGTRIDASQGIVYRDPKAQWPESLRGSWFEGRYSCTAVLKNTEIGAEGRVNIGPRNVTFYEGGSDLNVIRVLSRTVLAADVTVREEDGTGYRTEVIRQNVRDGSITLEVDGTVRRLQRCVP